jgi:flagellar biosynthesis/type III secretory pathway M-ring protein FliF/YscJ
MADLSDMESNIASKQRSTRLFVIVIGIIIVGVGGLFFFQTRPEKPAGDDTIVVSKTSPDKGKIKYKRLHSQMENDVTSQAIKELSLHGIAFDVERSGRFFDLSVDRRYYESAKNLLALKGIPSRGATGFELLDEDQGFGVTEYDKRIRYNRALAGELSKMIAQFYDVQDSQVRIVFPEKASWQKKQPPVTASVLVRGVDGRRVSDKTVFSIMNLVQNSIENLEFSNISVVDTYSNVLSIGIEERIKTINVSQSTAPEIKQTATPIVSVKPKAPVETIQEKQGVDSIDSEAWLDARNALKISMEQDRLEKMNKMLMGVLPNNTYQSTLSIEFSDVIDQQFNAVDIKRMTISIVVDSDQIPILEPVLKKKIFSVVAGSVAYVQGRDTIQLNLASLGLDALPEPVAVPDASPDYKQGLSWIQNYQWIGIGGLATLLIGSVGLYWRRRRAKQIATVPLYPEDVSDPVASKLKILARQNPESIASIITRWVTDTEEAVV